MSSLLRDKRLYSIFGVTIVSVMGVASLTPALPKMSMVLGLSKTEIGLLISFFTLPGVFLTPFTGMLADRVGRKKILVPSLFIFAIAGFSLFFTRSFHIMLLLRFIQGIGAASLPSLNMTLVGDFYKGYERPTAMGYNASVLSFAAASYPLIGGALAGIAWYYPFMLPLLGIPVAFFLMFCAEEPEIAKAPDFRNYFSSMAKSVFRKEVIAIFSLGVLTFIIMYGGMITYMPFLLHQKFQLSSPEIGIVISTSSVVAMIVASQIGRLTKRFGSVSLLKVAFGVYAVVTLTFPFINNLYLMILPILFFGFAQALNMPSIQTSLANMAPDNLRGAFMSLNGMNLRLGQTIAPLVVGLGYSFGGIKGAYFLVSGVAFVGLFVIFTFIDEKKICVKTEE